MNSRIKWNSKHKERLNQQRPPEPNPRLKNLSAYLTGGRALDLACGLGGNSFFLTRLNYEVEAIDISEVAIHYIQEQVSRDNLTIHPKVCDLTELNNQHWRNQSFDLVVITYFLDRSLFPLVKNLVKEGGYFFMETFYQSPQTENQGVSNQYKLHPKELLTEFGDWKVHFFEEVDNESIQTIFCKKQ
ncbi:class I SAM-dependent methyltransferase [Neobacillus rhizosphaerae]|uniref:class I SAM-dependent methyltransferase n=1 Tax=Neobacillus rhizosphaerae TaxID=2880965 RepID=UPI003D2E6F43